jgi:hypothetical protein
MSLASNLLSGQLSEWALLKKHPSEKCFGVQVRGGWGGGVGGEGGRKAKGGGTEEVDKQELCAEVRAGHNVRKH